MVINIGLFLSNNWLGYAVDPMLANSVCPAETVSCPALYAYTAAQWHTKAPPTSG